MSKHELSIDILNDGLFQLSPAPPTLIIVQCSSFRISLDIPLTCSINTPSISGNIIIQITKQIKNRDFHIQFIGSCIRYSNNPYKSIQQSDRSIIRHESVSEFVSDILNHTSKREIDTDTNEEIFLEGSQILRYVDSVENEHGEEIEVEIDVLRVGKYYIPFEFQLPAGSPPSVGMIGFINIFFTYQYKIIIHQFLTQPIVLQRSQKQADVEQLLCTTQQLSFRRCCVICLGDYCLQGIVRIVFNSLHVKLQFYRKGEKNQNKIMIQNVKVSLIAEIVGVGKYVIDEMVVVLEDLVYGIKGLEFILCNLNKLKMKSYNNSQFQLRYYLSLESRAVTGINSKIKNENIVFIDI